MKTEEMITVIIDEAFYIHKTIGPGLLENVYKTCLAYRLRKRGLYVETEKPVPVVFEEVKMECGYRSDLVVENQIVVDTKTIDAFAPLHTAQLLTYLQFLHLKIGLILNFKTYLMKDGIKRVVRNY
jgi:GxxExxY protein